MVEYSNTQRLVAVLLIVGLFASVGLLFYSLAYENTPRSYTTDEQRIDIRSIQDNTNVGGLFQLGTGYIESYPVYTYYIRNSDGGYKLGTAPAGRSVIYMDENISPHVIVKTKSANYKNLVGEGHSRIVSIEYVFHVPENTIVQEFNLDSRV